MQKYLNVNNHWPSSYSYFDIVRDVRQNKGSILKASVEYIKKLKVSATHKKFGYLWFFDLMEDLTASVEYIETIQNSLHTRDIWFNLVLNSDVYMNERRKSKPTTHKNKVWRLIALSKVDQDRKNYLEEKCRLQEYQNKKLLLKLQVMGATSPLDKWHDNRMSLKKGNPNPQKSKS